MRTHSREWALVLGEPMGKGVDTIESTRNAKWDLKKLREYANGGSSFVLPIIWPRPIESPIWGTGMKLVSGERRAILRVYRKFIELPNGNGPSLSFSMQGRLFYRAIDDWGLRRSNNVRLLGRWGFHIWFNFWYPRCERSFSEKWDLKVIRRVI